MRLLLDEHYSPLIAEHLRARGHDVTAVVAQPSLAGLADRTLILAARRDGRALLTGSLFAVGEAMEVFGGAPGEWL